MTASPARSYIHYDPERIDYSVSKDELQRLRNCSQSNWKDFGVACLAVGLPCVINAISEARGMAQFAPTLSFVLNLVVGIVGIALGIAFVVAWQRTKDDVDAIVTEIKNKPKIDITPSMVDLGAMAENPSQQEDGQGR